MVAGLAHKFGFAVARLQTAGDYDHNICRTDWMVLSRDTALIERLEAAPESVPVADREIVWTDALQQLVRDSQITRPRRRDMAAALCTRHLRDFTLLPVAVLCSRRSKFL